MGDALGDWGRCKYTRSVKHAASASCSAAQGVQLSAEGWDGGGGRKVHEAEEYMYTYCRFTSLH